MKTQLSEVLTTRRRALEMKHGEHYTLTNVAKRAGISLTTLIQWEGGITSPSTFSRLNRWARSVDGSKLNVKLKT